jgi:hypothetical protein
MGRMKQKKLENCMRDYWKGHCMLRYREFNIVIISDYYYKMGIYFVKVAYLQELPIVMKCITKIISVNYCQVSC